MRRGRIFLTLVLALALLSILTACSSGDIGNEEITFVRAGGLWTIDPDGTNAFELEAPGTPILNYGLSPDHQIYVFRTLDSDFAKTFAGKHLAVDPITGLVGDVPGALNTIGIDGGTPIPLTLSAPDLMQSNAWWNPTGNHLLYRQAIGTTASSPVLESWWISQSDQPLGIARKLLLSSYSIPSLNANGSLVVGNSAQGIFTTNLAGADLTLVQRGTLPGHPLPASLERILWQPGQQNAALLYAIPSSITSSGNQGRFALMLRTASGQTQVLTRCNCQQFAWSPDGSSVLYRTDQGYTLLNIQRGTSFHFTAELDAAPYWSPDSRTLLLDGLHTLTLVNSTSQQTQVLLSDGRVPVTTGGSLSGKEAILQPVANSLWNTDNQRFVFTTRGRTLWQGKQLSSGNGLYFVTLNEQDEPQGPPTLVDKGDDTQPGWSYVDPSTSFLF
jgi:hypothetical protein